MGRKKSPPVTTKPATKTDVRLRVDEPLRLRLEAAARAEGNPVAAFIRSTMVAELDRREAKLKERREAK